MIAAGRLRLFDLDECHLGDPIDWNRDPKTGKRAPMRFAASIDYRDFDVTGDCKFVWEPNRHHHLVVLGRAYRAGGDLRYAEAARRQLDSWLQQCPYGMGMNWRSGLELAIRLINWVWTIDLIRESGLLDGEFRRRLLRCAYLHLWEISRKYSRGSSANNHLIGEAAGVFIGSSYFRGFQEAPRWRTRSREILCEQILQQTFSDGGGREQALGYHLFILQFLLLAGLVARRTGEDFPAAYWSRLEKMMEFLAALSEGGSNPPMFGDCDDGYVLDLGGEAGDARPWLAAGAILFGRADFKAAAGGFCEPARWLLGRSAQRCFEEIAGVPADARLSSRAFPESGYYLLQHGRRDGADAISIVFDCGDLGFQSIAAHGHADALSFTLRAFGIDVLVDPGTYDYFSYPRWRDYFRSTRAHNTVVVDGQDQSEMLGPFLWGRRARTRCCHWQPEPTGGRVTGEHDGYRRLKDPVVHRRTVELDGIRRQVRILDEILARRRHEIALYFHVAEDCRVTEVGRNRYEIDTGRGSVTMELDRRLMVRPVCGSEEPIGGWVSRGYHRKRAGTTLIGRCQSDGAMSLECRIEIGRPGPGGMS